MWMMTGIFSKEYFAHYRNRNRYFFFNLMTLGATLGVMLSDDLFTTYVFFEIMSLTSYVWVAHEENDAAMSAASTYLTVAVVGGLTALMGLFLIYHELGTLSFDAMKAGLSVANPSTVMVASWLVVVGFGAKAGLFPLHVWLPKAHPVAPAPASALLSGILTKSGVFGLIVVVTRLVPGNAAFANSLLFLAVITMFLGAFLALFSTDLKRTLACSSMSQIGFITVGLSFMSLLGEHGTLAGYGAVLHMVNHSLIKLVLFMAAGVVYMNLHKLNLNDIRGFGRNKLVLHVSFLLGALAIACVPPIGSGYASKSLLHEGILEWIAKLSEQGGSTGIYRFVEALFMVSGGLTVAYMTKLYICLFWQKHPTRQAEFDGMRKTYIRPASVFALLGSALVLPLLSVLPNLLMSPLGARSAAFLGVHPAEEAIAYFSLENLKGAGISIGIGIVLYLLASLLLTEKQNGIRMQVNRWPEKLDLDTLIYRPLVWKLLPDCVTAIVRFIGELPENAVLGLRSTLLSPKKTPIGVPVGNPVTYGLGRLADGIALLLNKTLRRKRPIKLDFEYRFDAFWQELKSGAMSAAGSMSFGLLLLIVGLYITVMYIVSR